MSTSTTHTPILDQLRRDSDTPEKILKHIEELKAKGKDPKEYIRSLMAHRIATRCLEAVAPPGFEHVVKELKKDDDIDNPWALAWSMKNNGDKTHKESGMSAERIVARYLAASSEVAMEFDTPEAMKTYLDAHPGADKSKHKVKKPGEGKPSNDNDAHRGEVAKADHRKQETQKIYDDMKSLKTKVDNGDSSAKKKFERAYDKLYEQGEAAAKAAEKLMPKLDEDGQAVLHTALSEWDRNKSDHTKGRGEYTHKKMQQAEQTWGYATQLDHLISGVVRGDIS